MQDKIILITFKSGGVQYISLDNNPKTMIDALEYISAHFDSIEEFVIVEQVTWLGTT